MVGALSAAIDAALESETKSLIAYTPAIISAADLPANILEVKGTVDETAGNAKEKIRLARKDKKTQPNSAFSFSIPGPNKTKIRKSVINKNDFLDRVEELVINPEKLDQGHIDACGFVAGMYGYIRSRPVSFVKLCLGLLTTKSGRFGSKVIRFSRTTSELRKADAYSGVNRNHIVDWILLHSFVNSFGRETYVSLGEDSGVLTTLGNMPMRVSAAILPGEMSKIIKLSGYSITKSVRSKNSTNKMIELTKGVTKGNRNIVVVSLVFPGMINAIDKNNVGVSNLLDVPSHWVVISEGLKKSSDGKKVRCTIESWGETFTLESSPFILGSIFALSYRAEI